MSITKEAFNEELKQFTAFGREAIAALMDINTNGEIPNQMTTGDDQTQFNIVLSEVMRNLHINFTIYLANINSYMVEVVMFFPQDDVHYPREATKENALITFSGSPLLGATHYEKPIGALSLDEAVEAALEYVYDNFEDMCRETMGDTFI